MRLISILLMYFGYVLLYAATAAGGKFALEPWLGLFADAYTEKAVDDIRGPLAKATQPPDQPPATTPAERRRQVQNVLPSRRGRRSPLPPGSRIPKSRLPFNVTPPGAPPGGF